MAILDVYPGDSIQSIVNQANDGDDIIVHDDNGSSADYKGNINVSNKTLNFSADGDVTVTAIHLNQPCIEINNGKGSIIKGFKLVGPNDGISLNESDGCRIIGNTFTHNNYFGVAVNSSHKIQISDNDFKCFNGIAMYDSENSKINNNIMKKVGTGININKCNYLNISENQLECLKGMSITDSPNCKIAKNELYNNNTGIYLENSDICEIIENKIEIANDIGIKCISCNNFLVSENFISNVDEAIVFYQSGECEIRSNKIQKSNNIGIGITGSHSFKIHKNDISNNQGGISIDDSNQTEIYENNLYSNYYGIYLFNSFANINFNRIYNIGIEIFNNFQSSRGVVNVDNNWWGSNLGTKKIGGTVQYSTWLTLSLIVKNRRYSSLSDTFTANIQSSQDRKGNIFDLNTNSAGNTSTQYLPDGIMMEFENYPTQLLPKIKLYTKEGQIPIAVGKKNPRSSEHYKAKLDQQTIKGQIIL